MRELDRVLADLVTESEVLAEVLAGLDEPQWRMPTPAPGWTVAHQVAHLTADFQLATLAAGKPSAFEETMASAGSDFDETVAAALEPFLDHSPAELLDAFRHHRDAGVTALSALDEGRTVPWIARPLTAALLASAGVMELFAHGQDIVDTLGAVREPTDRLRHVVTFALGNWDYGYRARGLTPPAAPHAYTAPFAYVLTAPSGDTWHFGTPEATQRITGPAHDFCLLVTRRRHRADLALGATGDEAQRWLDIAQGYRGAPGPGRSPGQFQEKD